MNKRQKVFDKYGGKCAYCGCDLVKGWHVDHLEPIRRNWEYVYTPEGFCTGKKKEVECSNPHLDTIENMMPACASCNINKHSDSIEDFRNNIKRFLQSLNKRMVQYQVAKRYGLIEETGREVVFYFEMFKINQP